MKDPIVPSTPEDILPYMRLSTAGEQNVFATSHHWHIVAGPDRSEHWFEVNARLRGTVRQIGWLGKAGILHMWELEDGVAAQVELPNSRRLGDTTEFTFMHPPESHTQDVNSHPFPLQVAATGVLKYLHGYDEAESTALEERLNDAIAADQERTINAVDTLVRNARAGDDGGWASYINSLRTQG